MVKVKASAVHPLVREKGNTEEVWGCWVDDGRESGSLAREWQMYIESETWDPLSP